MNERNPHFFEPSEYLIGGCAICGEALSKKDHPVPVKVKLNFLSPYAETPTGRREIKNKYCQGCFMWLPAEVFKGEDNDYCEDCLNV